MKAYAEVGLGYSRRITEKLTVGARVKVLLGLARAEMNINQFDLDLEVPNPNYASYQDYSSNGELSPSDWYGAHYNYSADGNVITTLKGGGMTFDNNGMIDDFDLDAGAYRDWETDRKSTRLNSSHITRSRMPSSA